MREIKFRGKKKDSDIWLYGNLVYTQGIQEDWTIGIQQRSGDGYRPWGTLSVIPSTVGQYTGLRDKNGTEIYEGDIILTQEFKDKPYSKRAKKKRHVGVVKYCIHEGHGFYNPETKEMNKHKQWGAEWEVDIKDMGEFSCHSWGKFFDCEVIGNIHENPELLEVPIPNKEAPANEK